MRLWQFSLIFLLCGCSPQDRGALSPGALSLTSEAEAFPADYKLLVQRDLGFGRRTDLLISRPDRMLGSTVLDEQRWFACVRQPGDGEEVVFVFHAGAIEGKVPGPAPQFCDAGAYDALG